MNEKIKGFWTENKESIKTTTILALTPIAVLGVIAIKSMCGALDEAAQWSKKERLKEGKA